VIVIGAGPAGLSTARELTKHGVRPLVIDRNEVPGGLARTIWHNGHGFDIGPHRFFTKDPEVLELWREVLGDDLLEVERKTRIHYRGRFFSYPLKPVEALLRLGPGTSLFAIASYLKHQAVKKREAINFEDWVIQQFGRVLYEIFFKAYTEKVWGIPCDEIGREWAGQRIRGLSLRAALVDALGVGKKGNVRSLVERFYYPRQGAGQLYERMTSDIARAGGDVRMSTRLTRLLTAGGRVTAIETSRGDTVPVDHIFISAPITEVIQNLDPPAPEEVANHTERLAFRSHITVNLVVRGGSPFDDNWVYVHSPELKMARVANYASFSPDMVGTPGEVPISVEYFAFEDDDLWTMNDADLVTLAEQELRTSHLLQGGIVSDGFVVREADSYPTYYVDHRDDFQVALEHLSGFENLTLIGRAGMYRYNNQDHAALSGIYAARNHLLDSDVDLFAINPEDDYIEEIRPARKRRRARALT
jgi:protoporphyrinogen oxidase